MTQLHSESDTPSFVRRISAALRRPRTWIELAVFVALFVGVRAWQRRDLVQGVTTLPTTFVVDGDGAIRSTEVGFTSSLGMRARLWFAD